MPCRPARFTQANIARALRATKLAGVHVAVEIALDGTIRLIPTDSEPAPGQCRYRDDGGTSDQRMQLSTARWPWVPNSRWQRSLIRSGMRSGSSGPQALKRTSDNIKSNILIWLGGGQSGVACQVHFASRYS
jgi:hypothetical protein